MELQIFENSEFGSVRTLLDENGSVLFCGSDVAQALAYTNPPKAIRDHCKGRTKRSILTNGGRQVLVFIPEPDVYRLIFRSKLPIAEKFEAWVVGTVLPSLRRHGAYITPEMLARMEESPEFTSQLVNMLRQAHQRSDDLEKRMESMTVKADYFDRLVATDTLTNIRQTAKELCIPERLFTYLLEDMKCIYRPNKQMILPYAFMVNCGYAKLKEYTRNGHGGVYMLFTPVGRLYLERKITRRLAVKKMEESK